MKRKALVLLTAMMLVAGNVMGNLSAYGTSTTEWVGNKYNNSQSSKTAYIYLTPTSGVARAQIRDIYDTVLASEVYPEYPHNPHYTQTGCPAYNSRNFYALSELGNYVWGSQTYGLSSYNG
ncbi:MAG: hypothetical protein IKD90_01035 [Clostridiales bacterium]|nr:hypothetical protein [Clostridiales bacterium]